MQFLKMYTNHSVIKSMYKMKKKTLETREEKLIL